MSNFTNKEKPPALFLYVDTLLGRWHVEVLMPLQLMASNPDDLPKEHAYWAARRRTVEFGVARLLSLPKPDYDYADRAEETFTDLHDFLNTYTREVLDVLGLADRDGVSLDHPFFEARRNFILLTMPAIQALVDQAR